MDNDSKDKRVYSIKLSENDLMTISEALEYFPNTQNGILNKHLISEIQKYHSE